jgi:transcriptional regulator with XRE-family HTH domain
MPSHDTASSIASRTRSILAVRGLSLSDVARDSRTLFRGDPRFHVPPNLYHALDRRGFSPSIHQLFALSRLSDFRLVDWLAVFGVVLDDIPRLQATLPSRYTTLIDENIYDDHSWALSFQPVASGFAPGSIRPLQEWLRVGHPRRWAEVKRGPNSEFGYAKIGCYDAFAFPELLPGSIVRVAKHQILDTRTPSTGPTGSVFLLEHAKGLVCSKLYVAERNRVVLYPSVLPFAQVELELEREVRVVGTVEFELRSTAAPICPKVPLHLARFWIPAPLEELSNTLHLDRLLRRARQRSGLTFREASAKSGLIARVLGNKEFFCAPGSLSDYETATQAPRHIHKMFSLCVLYSLSAWEFMSATGLRPSEAGKRAMPDQFLGRAKPLDLESISDQDIAPSVQSETAVAEFPYFFGGVAAELLNLPHLSIRDIFWVEGPRESFHPYFRDAAALIVDRRKKRITTYRACPLWAQPSYILLGHEENYVCASCGSDGRTLVMRPFSNGFTRPVRFRRPEDVEVIGRVVGILRRVSSGELLGS